MRLAAQAKGGFYPTPDKVVDMIATLIDTPRLSYYSRGKTVRILDPCCGAGDAVAQLAESLNRPNTVPIETFGVELHKDRAEEAQGHGSTTPWPPTSSEPRWPTGPSVSSTSTRLMTGMPGTRKEWSTVSSPTAPATSPRTASWSSSSPGPGWRFRPATWPPTTGRSGAGPSPSPREKPSTRWCSWGTGRLTHPPTPTQRGG